MATAGRLWHNIGCMNKIGVNLSRFDQLPQAIVIDLDGTLLNSESQVSQRNDVALKECVSRGIPVVIATSRPARTVRRVLNDNLAEMCSFITMNGTVAWTVPPLTRTIREALPEEVVRGIIDLLEHIEPKVRITLEIDGYEFGSNIPRTPEELWRVNAATPDMMLTTEAAIARKPVKIAISRRERGDVSDLADAVLRHFGKIAAVFPSDNMTLLSIVSVRASKSGTLLRLLKPHGILLKTVLAFGDDVPDIDLLSTCGISIAMGNAVPEVIAVADYKTVSNDEDGVAVVLEKMLASSDK